MPNPLVIVTLCLAFSIYIVKEIILPLRENIRKVKATNLPYVVVPFYHYNFKLARVYSRTILRFLDWFSPDPSVTSWRCFAAGLWPLKLRYAPFKALGKDIFWIVSPGGRILNVADADINYQILKRGEDFPKAIQIYDLIRIYGDNVVSSDGIAMKRHRNIVVPAFGQKNECAVWEAALEAAKTMVEAVRNQDGSFGDVEVITDNIRRLSLEVLGRAGLGQRLEWPQRGHKSLPDGSTKMRDSRAKPSFAESLEYIVTHVTWVLTVKNLPQWVQTIGGKLSPSFSEALHHYQIWGGHMIEMIQVKRQAISAGKANKLSVDLLGQLIKGQSEDVNRKWSRLTDTEVLGNLFALIVAGHDTTTHTIHNALVYLAQNPWAQQKLQQELKAALGERPFSEWTHERDYHILRNGFLGAVVQETLRLTSPVLTIPKYVSSTAGPLKIDGELKYIPENSLIRIVLPATHRNPKFWPSASHPHPKKSDLLGDMANSDLEGFKSDRWLDTATKNEQSQGLLVPVRGSYLPFSSGSRICLGQRFAEAEIFAVLATILNQYSVELAVDKTDEEVAAMGPIQKKTIWENARQEAEDKMQNKMTCIITVQLQKNASIPLRFADRGKERFFNI